MRLIINIAFLLILNFSFSQTIKGNVLDSLTQKPLEFANVTLMTRNKGVYTNEKGAFLFEIKKHLYDTLKISSIGYASKFITLNKYKNQEVVNLNVLLNEKITELEEVIINSKKLEYKNRYRLGEKKNGITAVSSLIGYETGVFIENPFNKEGKLKTIRIKLMKRDEVDFIASLNIKFYRYDVINKKPGTELYSKNVVVKPKNRNYTLKINVEDFNIFLPEEGMCIGVEFIDPNNQSKKYDRIGPMYRFKFSNEEELTWSKYRGKYWKPGFVEFKRGNYNNNQNLKGNVMIGLDVLMPKD
ncbi:carboxypeptidase-like regulatory domain-containing protein [Bizionia hallyeonensis]|uniref:Carboxypeptidase-like regulatory domain-containing protein n=1 Tax=Bizionia hallyeonensis TaxID=1123757 RepID=A0ABW0C483_9FLAO